jgi:hypothetical protein
MSIALNEKLSDMHGEWEGLWMAKQQLDDLGVCGLGLAGWVAPNWVQAVRGCG